ncbi:hypothetical protein WUBG_12155, partial [Wuchereria bancrofti]
SLAESTDFSPHTIRQYAFSINSIQLFVYMITPLLNVINEKDLTSNFRLESGLKNLAIALAVSTTGSIMFLCSGKTTPYTSSIYNDGDEGETISRRLSNVPAQIANPPPYSNVPPPKPPRPYLAVLSSLSKQKEGGEAEIPAIQVSATSGFDRQQQQQQQQMLSIKNRSSAVVRSVSDYHTSDIPRIFTKSHTTAFDETSPSSYKGMRELDDALNFVDDKSLSNAMDDAEVSAEKAPLVALQEICSGISADFENTSHSA